MILDILRTMFAEALRRDAEHRAAVERAHKAAQQAEEAARRAHEAARVVEADWFAREAEKARQTADQAFEADGGRR